MNINDARFVKSSSSVWECPEDELPEYAFIGRSNVGKSSLINMLTEKPKLALTGNTPGKTRLINHFLINNAWYIVDLPGYGFAKRGLKEGIALIQTKFEAHLKAQGVEPMDPVGKPFNMSEQQAVATVPATEEYAAGIVMDCTKRGYKLHDKVLRYADVVVAQ